MEADHIAAHRGMVRGVLLRLLRDETLADDLVQDALLRATRAAAAMRGEASVSTWLTAIALNVARDHFRAAKRIPQVTTLDHAEDLPGDSRPDGEAMNAEMSARILGHVTRLPKRQREAVLMHHFGGLGHREIGSVLGISEGNARVILHRGLSALRTSLSRECSLNFKDAVPCEKR